MTVEEVQEIVRLEIGDDLACSNAHRITLRQALVSPRRIAIIVRMVKNGRPLEDERQVVWLVGQENAEAGYRIVMRERDHQFGLASPGFAEDKHPILTGWYGGLKSAFLSM
jgi:hypothetical protein